MLVLLNLRDEKYYCLFVLFIIFFEFIYTLNIINIMMNKNTILHAQAKKL